MQADPNSDGKTIRPGSVANLALDADCRLETGHRTFEDGEHLISAGFDLAATGCADGRAKQAANVSQEPVISVTKAAHEPGRVLDIGEEKGHDTGRQRPYFRGASLDLAVHPLVFDGKRDRGRDRPGQVRIVQEGALVNQGGHRLSLALEEGHRGGGPPFPT